MRMTHRRTDKQMAEERDEATKRGEVYAVIQRYAPHLANTVRRMWRASVRHESSERK